MSDNTNSPIQDYFKYHASVRKAEQEKKMLDHKAVKKAKRKQSMFMAKMIAKAYFMFLMIRIKSVFGIRK